MPKPAGADMRVSLRPTSRSSLAVSRGRATSFERACEGRSLVYTSESVVASGSPPALILLPIGVRIVLVLFKALLRMHGLNL